MVMFCAAIRRDSVSLLRCPGFLVCNFPSLSFLDFVVIFMSDLTLPLLLLGAMISLSWLFLMLSSSPYIDVSKLAYVLVSRFTPFFLDICSMSMSFLGLMVQSTLHGNCLGVYPFDEISATEFGSEKLSRSSEILFFI